MPLLKREPDLFPDDLFASGAIRAPWWVAQTRSRREKGLARWLGEHGVAFYLPCQAKEVRRQGRRLTSYLPLFPGYVFFRGDASERLAALRSRVVAQTLEVVDQGQLEEELDSIWRLQRSGLPLVPHPYLGPGDEVEILEGPLQGFTGTVLREQGRLRLVVAVTLLRRAVSTVLDRDILAPLVMSGARRGLRATR